ncbi:MAG: PAS domain-containing protein [Proteobacteria bacterium]|nr:PAS domain-containing protein [Pseudomonadota bacterium]MBU1687079.1 PAS domain-containing protein [Pseudomonadota bacterium]
MVMEKKLRQSLEFAEDIINTVREPLIVLDQDLRVVSASRSFYKVFQVKPEETVGQLIYDLGDKQWDIPKLRELLETILPQKTSFVGYEVEHDFATIGRRTMLLNARQIEQAWGKERIILLAIEDITERKAIETGLETTRKELEVVKKLADAAHEFAESVINTVREPLISLDQDLRVVTVSRSFYDFFQVKPEDTVGQLIYDLGDKQWDIPKLRELLETILPEKTSFDNYEVEHDFATIGRRVMLLNARQIKQVWGKERIILLAIEDITERSRLEDLLAESEFRYRRLFETASDGIVLLEKKEGRVAHANSAFEKMLGYSEAECLGKNLSDIGVSIDTRHFSATMGDLDREGILNYEDIFLQTRSGQGIYTDIYLVDRAILAQCNIRDVTERKLVQETLKEEQLFIENALNSLQDVFFVFDLEGRFIRWNNPVSGVTGYTDGEIAQLTPVDLFRGDDINRIATAIETATTTGSVKVDALFVTKEGKRIPYSFSASLLRDASGTPMAICGLGRDITERM